MKKYKLIVSKNQEQKLNDWTFIEKDGRIKYVKVKWKNTVFERLAAACFMEEEQQASSQPEGRETA